MRSVAKLDGEIGINEVGICTEIYFNDEAVLVDGILLGVEAVEIAAEVVIGWCRKVQCMHMRGGGGGVQDKVIGYEGYGTIRAWEDVQAMNKERGAEDTGNGELSRYIKSLKVLI